MGWLDGRVAIITGGGRGLGWEYASLMASEGASVVINDIDCAADAAARIVDAGGKAIGVDCDAADWGAAHGLVETAVGAFGDLHVLVNNAGNGPSTPFLRTGEDEWDNTIRGNLKATFSPTRAAGAYWERQSQAGKPVAASVINTASGAGLQGNAGRNHYGSAKAGIAAFTIIVAYELAAMGVRVNAISPAARTRRVSGGLAAEHMKAPDDPAGFDAWHPREAAPLVAWLATADCPVTGQVFQVRGGALAPMRGWRMASLLTSEAPWTIDEVARRVPEALANPAPDHSPRDLSLVALQEASKRRIVAG